MLKVKFFLIPFLIVLLGMGYFFWQKNNRHFVEYASSDGDLHLVWQSKAKIGGGRELFYNGILNDLLSLFPSRATRQDGKALIQGYVGDETLKKFFKTIDLSSIENYTLPSKIYFAVEKDRGGLSGRILPVGKGHGCFTRNPWTRLFLPYLPTFLFLKS
jgi:hypothetical protein